MREKRAAGRSELIQNIAPQSAFSTRASDECVLLMMFFS
jgi:hypothetical protein